MRINKIAIKLNNFRADTDTRDPFTGEYKDPLMHWPLRGAAFTNEVGEALRPIIGNYATLSWAPALLYIGADIYDKYKNEQTEYNPNTQRAFKQAVFQGLASILLPLVAVKAGQDLFSLFGYASKDKISLNSEEQIIKLAKEFVANGNMRAYHDKDVECVNRFKDIVSNNMDYHKNKTTNIIKRTFLSLEEKLASKFFIKKQKNIDIYAEQTINNLIKIRKNLLSPTEEFSQTKIYNKYKFLRKSGQTKNVAVKSALNSRLESIGIKGRFIKTLGGFVVLGIAIIPIDKFVDEVLIGKIINPTLNKKRPASCESFKL